MSLPPSSPRLPSPPPPAEIQIGPKSPMMGARSPSQIEHTALEANAKRRIHRGTKSADMAAGPPLVPLHELDSAFQLQEHLAALHYYHTASHTSPVTRDTAKLLATPPPGIDKTLWLCELCRFLTAQCNSLVVGFLFDTPPCSAATCPDMRAGEWQFLCALHDSPKNCCAIDYCCHTLDWAANVVTNPKIFPSRFVVDAHDKNIANKNLVNAFRRMHRIFAHAWFQHRGVFWSVESQTGLYIFFKAVCDIYDLLPAENPKLPPEAEGLDSSTDGHGEGSTDRRHQQQQIPQISIVKPPSQRAGTDDDNYSSVGRTDTRRHIKSSPSTGSVVTTVPEADEDEDADLSSKLREMHISASAAAAAGTDEELELANIPVIVEHEPPADGEQSRRPASVVLAGTAASEGWSAPAEPSKQKTEASDSSQEQEAQPPPDSEPAAPGEEQQQATSAAEPPPIEGAQEDQEAPAAAPEPEESNSTTTNTSPIRPTATAEQGEGEGAAATDDNKEGNEDEGKVEKESEAEAGKDSGDTADNKDNGEGAKEDAEAAVMVGEKGEANDDGEAPRAAAEGG